MRGSEGEGRSQGGEGYEVEDKWERKGDRENKRMNRTGHQGEVYEVGEGLKVFKPFSQLHRTLLFA